MISKHVNRLLSIVLVFVVVAVPIGETVAKADRQAKGAAAVSLPSTAQIHVHVHSSQPVAAAELPTPLRGCGVPNEGCGGLHCCGVPAVIALSLPPPVPVAPPTALAWPVLTPALPAHERPPRLG